MPRLVVFNDPHYTVEPPECRADTYRTEVLAKFHEVARLAVKLKAAAIGCTGDWFHRKGKVTFRESNDLLAVLSGWRKLGLEVVGILGNHDIAGHALESMDSRAVGTFVHSKILHLLDHEPWSADDEEGHLVVTGTSYFHGCDDSDEARVRMYGSPVGFSVPEVAPSPGGKDPGWMRDRTVHVHFAHGTLLQRGEFFESYTTAEPLIELLCEVGRCPDVIICGHLHFSEGVKTYERPDGKGTVTVCRVGSTGRVAADDLERQPSALLVATRGRKAVFREIPIGKPVRRPDSTTGPDGQPVDPKEHEQRIREFVRVLREEADEFSLSDHRELLREIVDRMGHGEEVYEAALKAVERRQ